MSHLSFPQNGIFNFPSIPLFGETLKLIETKKNFNITNTLSFFQKNIIQSEKDFYDQENSLENQINNQNKYQFEPTDFGATPKKKKTGCICKKTKCLKMYCQCFASGKLCTNQCVCYSCNNNWDGEKLIEKAKQSIKQKNQSNQDQSNESKGCNCKKSQCQKKYCECFNAGIACGQTCKCEQCANMEEPGSNNSQNSITLLKQRNPQ